MVSETSEQAFGLRLFRCQSHASFAKEAHEVGG